jgi:hypothetical protein
MLLENSKQPAQTNIVKNGKAAHWPHLHALLWIAQQPLRTDGERGQSNTCAPRVSKRAEAFATDLRLTCHRQPFQC